MNTKHFLWLMILTTTVSSAKADLVWDTKKQEVKASTKEEVVHAIFTFKNTGDKPVNIEEPKSSCECISATISATQIAPSASGQVDVTFRIKGRSGLQQKSIEIVSDDPTNPKVSLDLSILLNHSIQASPAVLWWKAGKDAQPLTTRITSESAEPLRVEQFQSSTTGWKFQLKPVEKAKDTPVSDVHEYILEVTPESVAERKAAFVTLENAASKPDAKDESKPESVPASGKEPLLRLRVQ